MLARPLPADVSLGARPSWPLPVPYPGAAKIAALPGNVTRFQSVLVSLIDEVSVHRPQIGIEGERGPKKADQQKMEPSLQDIGFEQLANLSSRLFVFRRVRPTGLPHLVRRARNAVLLGPLQRTYRDGRYAFRQILTRGRTRSVEPRPGWKLRVTGQVRSFRGP